VSANNNTNRLGKGLDALIPTEIEHIDDFAAESLPQAAKITAGNVNEVDIDSVDANPHQPRTEFEQTELQQLADSIKKHGIVQPLVVSAENDWRYQLIAGERRLRAAKLAGLKKVPVVVRTLSEQQQLEIAILENVQRADLKPLELAVAYSKLVDQFNMTHAKIGASVGKAESTITNIIRLLKLTPKGKQALIDGKITEGHARQLLAMPVEAQDTFLAYIIRHDLTVRATEEAARDFKGGVEIKKSKVKEARAQQTEYTKNLGKYLGTKVDLLRTAKGGKLQIEYYSDEELGRIYGQIMGEE
jgi:ParB family chromosome partitioning protein